MDILNVKVSRRAKIGRRADKAPLEGRTLAKNYPRDGRLHYPWYQTMYEHEPSDPHKRRHETIRSIYLWNVPPEKRADKPKTDATRQKHFESKYRSMLKDRADHEWSRKYYYPRDDYAQPFSSSSRKCERCEAREKHEHFLDRYSSSSNGSSNVSSSSSSYSSSYTPSYSSSYAREPSVSTSSDHSQTTRSTRPVRDIPSLEASKSSRRLDRYLSKPESTTSTTRSERGSRTSQQRSSTTTDAVATSSSSSYSRAQPDDTETTKPSRSRVSSSSSSSSASSASPRSQSIETVPAEHHIVESIPSQSALLEDVITESAVVFEKAEEDETVSKDVVTGDAEVAQSDHLPEEPVAEATA